MFSSKNRITRDMLKGELCKNAWGTQLDCQCLGYDTLCALASLMEGDSYQKVWKAQEEVRLSPYSKGFQEGWDQHNFIPSNEEERIGYQDGLEISKSIKWSCYSYNDGVIR